MEASPLARTKPRHRSVRAGAAPDGRLSAEPRPRMMPGDVEASSSVREPPTTELGCGTLRASWNAVTVRSNPRPPAGRGGAPARRQGDAPGHADLRQASATPPTLSSQRRRSALTGGCLARRLQRENEELRGEVRALRREVTMLRGRLSTEETDQGVTEALLVALRESELAQQTNREAMTALRRHHAAQVTEHEVEVSGLR